MPLASSRSLGRPARIFIVTKSSTVAIGTRTPSSTWNSARSRNCSSIPGPASTTSTGSRVAEWTNGSTRVLATKSSVAVTRSRKPFASIALANLPVE